MASTFDSDDMTRCRSCRKRIIWAITGKMRRIPIDPDPTPDGNIVLQDQGKFRPPLATVHTVRPPDTMLYKSHFATCPAAAAFRKRR